MSDTQTVCLSLLLLALIAAGVLGADTMRNCSAACAPSAVARFTDRNAAGDEPSRCECIREVAP